MPARLSPAADTPLLGPIAPFKTQLLKWIGNKQRFAHEIIGCFPARFGRYHEPFVGSGAVLGTLAPTDAVAGDALRPLTEIWQTLRREPALLVAWYQERWAAASEGDRIAEYERIKERYNDRPNPADLLFISRACYGGVIRFRRDGYLSTPCGAHQPIRPAAFARRAAVWYERTSGTAFVHADFEEVMDGAAPGDMVYCDPPYSDTQTILYGAQEFSLERLLRAVERCKGRGVSVALSLDGTKKSGAAWCEVALPDGLFEREAVVNCGRSMLRRFQMRGATLEGEEVRDRLLLTY